MQRCLLVRVLCCQTGIHPPHGHSPSLPRLSWCSDTYNPYLGSFDPCLACPEPPVGPGTWTSYAAAQQCDTERVDLACDSDACECMLGWARAHAPPARPNLAILSQLAFGSASCSHQPRIRATASFRRVPSLTQHPQAWECLLSLKSRPW